MKKRNSKSSVQAKPTTEGLRLLRRAEEAERTLLAIRRGEVDIVVDRPNRNRRLQTVEGSGEAYRTLIESMNEGALMLSADRLVLYANCRFATMVRSPLEEVIGGEFGRFLGVTDQAALRTILRRKGKEGATLQVQLIGRDGVKVPAQISFRVLVDEGPAGPTIGMVVTDMSAARRIEEEMRALSQRVVEVQEAERGRVALELHDDITQSLCAVQFRCQALVESLPTRGSPARKEADLLREMLAQTVKAVERIAQNLRPSVLDQLGLSAALREVCGEFGERTGIGVKLECEHLAARLPVDSELALYRILQIALRNVEQHAHATAVTVSLAQFPTYAQLAVADNGIGFVTEARRPSRGKQGKLGLLSMRERANYVGGVLTLTSAPGAGTVVEICLPTPPLIRL